jgi:hypothetical protein
MAAPQTSRGSSPAGPSFTGQPRRPWRLARIGARGFELAKPLKNAWPSDQYKGINTQWREPETGQRFEVQFHTSASFEAKQLTHETFVGRV